MKKKLLLIGWEQHAWENMITRELKELAEKFEIVFSFYDIQALDEIAKAKLKDENPICALVFSRNRLLGQPEKCRLIKDFAQEYSSHACVAITMIHNDQDRDARDHAVGVHFAQENDWKQVAAILDNNCKGVMKK